MLKSETQGVEREEGDAKKGIQRVSLLASLKHGGGKGMQ
jgi:hypothetical protein